MEFELTRNDAEAKAKRLSEENPGTVYHVMQHADLSCYVRQDSVGEYRGGRSQKTYVDGQGIGKLEFGIYR